MAVVIPRTGGFGSDAMNAAAAIIQGLNAARGEGQDQQMKLLALLMKDDENQVQRVPAGDVQSPNIFDRLFGGGGGTTGAGEPVFNVAGQTFKVSPRPTAMQQLAELARQNRMGSPASTTPTPEGTPGGTSALSASDIPQALASAVPAQPPAVTLPPPTEAPRATQRAIAQQGPLIQGDPGPPTPGMTRFNTTLDGQLLSRDEPTIEAAQAFFEQRFPGRTFQLTAEAAPATQPVAPAISAPSSPRGNATPLPVVRPLSPSQQQWAQMLTDVGYQNADMLVRDPGVLTVLSSRRFTTKSLGEAVNAAETRANLQEQRATQIQLRRDAILKDVETAREKAAGEVHAFFDKGNLTETARSAALTAIQQATDMPGIARVMTGLQILPVGRDDKVLAQTLAQTREDRQARQGEETAQQGRDRIQLTREANAASQAVHTFTQKARLEDRQYKRDEDTQKKIEAARGELREIGLQRVRILKGDTPDANQAALAYMAKKGDPQFAAYVQQQLLDAKGGVNFEAEKQQTLALLSQLQRYYIDQLPPQEQQTMHEIIGTPLVPAESTVTPVTRTK